MWLYRGRIERYKTLLALFLLTTVIESSQTSKNSLYRSVIEILLTLKPIECSRYLYLRALIHVSESFRSTFTKFPSLHSSVDIDMD
jgi:hypothetical protein